jgi:hypothetical protein
MFTILWMAGIHEWRVAAFCLGHYRVWVRAAF